MATEVEIAWAAGLFDGEGCVQNRVMRRNVYGERYQRFLSLNMTDPDVVERFRLIVGAGSIKRRTHKTRRKDIYAWRVTAWPDIERICGLLLPWMGVRRQASIRELLNNPPARYGGPQHTICKRGHPQNNETSSINSRGARVCKICARMRSAKWYAKHPDYHPQWRAKHSAIAESSRP